MWRERKDVRAGNSAREKIRERRPVDGKLPRRFRDWRDWRKQNLEYESRKVNFFPGRKCYVRPWATTSKFNPKRHVTLRFRERRTEIVLLFSFLSVFFFFLSFLQNRREEEKGFAEPLISPRHEQFINFYRTTTNYTFVIFWSFSMPFIYIKIYIKF